MIFYEGDDSIVMTPAAFKKTFGRNYSEFQKEDSDEAVIARKIKFADAHCCVDPYDEEINGVTTPLVRDNFVEMDSARTDSAYEI